MEKRRWLYACLIAVSCHSAEAPAADHVAQYRAAALERRSGVYPFVYDRNGSPLATNNDFKPFVALLALQRLGRKERITTTLDSDVQHIAMTSLGDLHASLVAIDPRTNEVLAIATTSPDPFIHQYEPGSVIKVLTLLAALSNGIDVQSFFPYDCEGFLEIDGRHFGDWHPGGHGRLPDVDEALAESCNVAFAAIGLKTGRDALRELHRRAGFDSHANLGLFAVPLGKTVGQIFNNFETGFYSIGLEHKTVTTFHLAMIASMLANRGALTTPRIYAERRTILGEIGQSSAEADDGTDRAKRGRGTRRCRDASSGRAAEGNGTPRERRRRVARAENRHRRHARARLRWAHRRVCARGNPRIAFALIAENAGAAEFAAAKVAHDFVEGLRASGHL